jgi:choline transport protein
MDIGSKELAEKRPPAPKVSEEAEVGEARYISDVVNTSGHKQELDRNFGLWSICAMSVCTDNAWAAGGGSLVST